MKYNYNYYVPVVVKNKDILRGYINGINFIKESIITSFEDSEYYVDFGKMEYGLDSSRFNDYVEDGRRISQMDEDEYRSYLHSKIEEKIRRFKDRHPENMSNNECLIDIECSCGFGFYSFNNIEEIPDDGFDCIECSRKLIDFTHKSDDEFEYDGVLNQGMGNE